jgi:ACR3 family arsenite efflux pump ArsB
VGTVEHKILASIRDHLDEWLGLYVGIMIVLGLLVGYHNGAWARQHGHLLKLLEISAIYMMIFPMMLLMDVEALKNAFRNHRLVTTVVLLNFVYSPLMAILLGHLFIEDPLVRLGLFIAWAVPCSSMSIGYVGLMGADVGAATAMVALSFLLSLVLLPTETSLYISKILAPQVGSIALSGAAIRHVEMNLVKTVLLVLVAPLVVAIPTLALLDYEREGGTPSLADIARKAGVSEETLLAGVKDKLVRAGLVEEESLTLYRIKTLRLTEKGRRLAECLEPCKDLIRI